MPNGWLKGGEQSLHLVPSKYSSQYALWERETVNSENNCFSKVVNLHFNLSTDSTLNGKAVFTKVSGGFFYDSQL